MAAPWRMCWSANTSITAAIPSGATLCRQSLNLDRSTLADWVGKAAFLLRPVQRRLFERLKASDKLFADATTAPVLDRGAAAPRRHSCSPMHAMMPPGAGSVRPALPTSIRPIVRPNSHSEICWTSSGSYSSRLCRIPAWPSAGRRFYELAQSVGRSRENPYARSPVSAVARCSTGLRAGTAKIPNLSNRKPAGRERVCRPTFALMARRGTSDYQFPQRNSERIDWELPFAIDKAWTPSCC